MSLALRASSAVRAGNPAGAGKASRVKSRLAHPPAASASNFATSCGSTLTGVLIVSAR